MLKINPFQPNSPVSPGRFVGRVPEIEALEKGLYQTQNGNSTNFLVTGERGIGKSSLLSYLKSIASGEYDSLNGYKFNFICVHTAISKNTNLATLVKLIEKQISREIGKVETVRAFLNETWAFAQRLSILDTSITKQEELTELDLIIDDFSYSLSQTCKRVTNPEKGEVAKDGFVFFIDEADNATPDLHIGYFLNFLEVHKQLLMH